MAGVSTGKNHELNKNGSDNDLRRTAISAERKKLESDFLTEDAACYKKFAVNNCLEKVNARRRASMSELRRQEVFLNDQERKIKSDKQLRKADEQSSSKSLQGQASRRIAPNDEYQGRLDREKAKEQLELNSLVKERVAREANAAKLLAYKKNSRLVLNGTLKLRKNQKNSNYASYKSNNGEPSNKAIRQGVGNLPQNLCLCPSNLRPYSSVSSLTITRDRLSPTPLERLHAF